MTPEHKINSKCYKVGCTILESEKKVQEVKCYDCPASEGGCKHVIAFLMWLHRRSEEPSPTETVCYWKKSLLSAATTSKKCITTADFGKKAKQGTIDGLSEYIEEAKRRRVKNSTLRYHITENQDQISLYWLKNKFMSTLGNRKIEYDTFKIFCQKYMTDTVLKEIEKNTKAQSKCRVWEEMRYGRITASKAYEAVKCVTYDGILVENILGANFFKTKAMKRGLDLEEGVIKILSESMSKTFRKCGIFLSADCPIIGASPDAIADDCIVEIKSPMFERTIKNYIDEKGDITTKFYHQIQMQMHLTKKYKAVFVVADPDFESNKKISFKTYDYDADFVNSMLKKIVNFWLIAIFNKI